jgi:hypothetical protein
MTKRASKPIATGMLRCNSGTPLEVWDVSEEDFLPLPLVN